MFASAPPTFAPAPSIIPRLLYLALSPALSLPLKRVFIHSLHSSACPAETFERQQKPFDAFWCRNEANSNSGESKYYAGVRSRRPNGGGWAHQHSYLKTQIRECGEVLREAHAHINRRTRRGDLLSILWAESNPPFPPRPQTTVDGRLVWGWLATSETRGRFPVKVLSPFPLNNTPKQEDKTFFLFFNISCLYFYRLDSSQLLSSSSLETCPIDSLQQAEVVLPLLSDTSGTSGLWISWIEAVFSLPSLTSGAEPAALFLPQRDSKSEIQLQFLRLEFLFFFLHIQNCKMIWAAAVKVVACNNLCRRRVSRTNKPSNAWIR